MTDRDEIPEKASGLAAAAKGADDSKKLIGMIEAFLVSNFPLLTRKEIQNMLQLGDIRESTIFQEGLQEGRQEGLQEGRQEGRQEGLQEGRQEGERKEKLATIARLLSKGRTVKEVCELMEVDEESVRQVKKSGSNNP